MKKVLLYLILLMAVSMAGIVAYVSVSGLLKVFTGAGTMGLMLFTAIEIAKIVATSAIHTYGKKIGWFYNGLLSLMIVISMIITSMGIYGFLSSTYKESFAKMENVDSQVELLEKKRDGYKEQLTFVISEKETLNTTIGELTKGLANNVIQYKDKETGQIITTTSSSTRKVLGKQLDNAVIRQSEVNTKVDELSVIIFELENDILETKLGNDSANELGTLKYLADVTGRSMDDVMKWFILLLIVIGDPMAVLMVIVFNKVVKSDDDGVEGLPMDSLIGQEPTIQPTISIQPLSKPVTGHINLPEDGLPMDSLIGDKPKEPIVDPETNQIPKGIGPDSEYNKIMGEQWENHLNPVTGHINLPEEALPMEEDIFIGNAEPKSDYVKQIQDKIRRDIPIEDDALNDAVNDAVNEYVELDFEPSLPNPSEMIVKEDKVSMDEPVEEPIVIGENLGFDPQPVIEEPVEEVIEEVVEPVEEVIEEVVEEVVENTPEEQIVENVEDVKQLKREPIIPRGKIIEEDVIKNKGRGFSVDVPEPKGSTHFFKRKRGDELGG